jgi:hypothetical protein
VDEVHRRGWAVPVPPVRPPWRRAAAAAGTVSVLGVAVDIHGLASDWLEDEVASWVRRAGRRRWWEVVVDWRAGSYSRSNASKARFFSEKCSRWAWRMPCGSWCQGLGRRGGLAIWRGGRKVSMASHLPPIRKPGSTRTGRIADASARVTVTYAPSPPSLYFSSPIISPRLPHTAARREYSKSSELSCHWIFCWENIIRIFLQISMKVLIFFYWKVKLSKLSLILQKTINNNNRFILKSSNFTLFDFKKKKASLIHWS